MHQTPTVKLNNNYNFPVIGLGTYNVSNLHNSWTITLTLSEMCSLFNTLELQL
jgi:hypothetical protein